MEALSDRAKFQQDYTTLMEMFPNMQPPVLKELLLQNKELVQAIDAALLSSNQIDEQKSLQVSLREPALSNPYAAENGRDNRGMSTNLPPDFLSLPKFRFVVNGSVDHSLEYSVTFRRDHDKLGFTVHQIKDGEIAVAALVRDSLGEKAGLAIGDVITGIDYEFFGPSPELKDVIDMLSLVGTFTTIHFRRRRRSDRRPSGGSSNNNNNYNAWSYSSQSCADRLVTSRVISPSEAAKVAFSLTQLKIRCLRWSIEDTVHRIKTVVLMTGITSGADGKVFSIPNFTSSTTIGNSDSTGVGIEMGGGSAASIRPALSAKITHAFAVSDHAVISYVVWVKDIFSGIEWEVQRTFDEFQAFREFLSSIRGVVSRFDFPLRRLNSSSVATRQILLQSFLLKVCRLIQLQPFHPSSVRVQLALQEFLGFRENTRALQHQDDIILSMSQSGDGDRALAVVESIVNIYVHGAVEICLMDKILVHWSGPGGVALDQRADADVSAALAQLRSFIDKLQNILLGALCDRSGRMRDGDTERINEVTEAASLVQRIRALHGLHNNDGSDGAREGSHATSSSRNSFENGAMGAKSSTVMEKILREWALADLGMGITDPFLDTSLRKNNSGTNEEDEMVRQLMKKSIRAQLEIEIFVPACIRIRCALVLSYRETQTTLSVKIEQSGVKRKGQSFFGIPDWCESPSGWAEAVGKLREVVSYTLPCDRLASLVEVGRIVPEVYKREKNATHNNQNNHSQQLRPIGGDELLSIFVFLFVQADLKDVLAFHAELQAMCDPDIKMSETGYYLATVEAALEYLLDADLSSAMSVSYDAMTTPRGRRSSLGLVGTTAIENVVDLDFDSCSLQNVDGREEKIGNMDEFVEAEDS